jgi:galactokinase
VRHRTAAYRSAAFMNGLSKLLAKFEEKFGCRARIYRAPGRVNIIGEHTDYNDGFVLPAAIGFSCWVGLATRADRKLIIHSDNFGETVHAELDSLMPPATGKWFDYPFGVAWALERAGNSLCGANLYIVGEVPMGAGLSSSAALEVAIGFALLDASHFPVDPSNLALLCQQAENEFVGARCGIMDQFTSCHGKEGHLLLLDCRSLDFELLRLPPHLRLVICNTMVKHDLSVSEYNARRAECEEGVRCLARVLPSIRALRDVSLSDLDAHRALLTDTIYRRCRHVVSENGRVLEASSAFKTGEMALLGQLMADSHRSLRDDYEVSCSELDTMVEIASQQVGVYGARMTGGGFGGCTISLVAAEHSLEFQRRVAAEYQAATGLRPDIYVCEASPGAEAVGNHAPGNEIEVRTSRANKCI